MFLDSSAFPYVWILTSSSTKEDSQESILNQFETLLAHKQPFILLNEDALANHKDTPEERKQTSLWIKKHKPELRAYVKGMVQIEPDLAKKQAAKAFAVNFMKVWGYPLVVVSSKSLALSVAQNVLANEYVSD